MFKRHYFTSHLLYKNWFLISILCLTSQLVSAQTPELDSLRHELARPALSDTSRVLVLKQLCWRMSRVEPKKALYYGTQGLALARRIGFLYGEVCCLNNLALASCDNDDIVTGTRYYQQSLRRIGTSSDRRLAYRYTIALLGLGRVRTETGNYTEASHYFQQALSRFQSGQHYVAPDDIAIAANNLAGLYIAWQEDQSTKAPDSVAGLAVRYSRWALGISRSNEASLGKVYCGDLTMLGFAYRLQHRLDSASYYFQQSLDLSQQIGDKRSQLLGFFNLAETRFMQQHYDQATKLSRAAITLSQQMGDSTREMESYRVLARALAATGDGSGAYQATLRQLALREVIETADRRHALARLQVSFDTERKESRIRELTQAQQVQQANAARQRQRFWLLGAVLLAVTVGLATTTALALRLRRASKLVAAQRDELVTARHTQDRLYSIVAHDLRSPVIAFGGLADLLTYYVHQQDTVRLAGLGRRIQQAAQGLTELLDNLLNWAISQRGELVAVPQTLRATDLLTEMVALYHNAALAAEVTLTYYAPTALTLWADPDMARTILRNLLSNALRATPAGGTVQLAAEPNGPEAAIIRIQDTGPGYPPEALNASVGSPHATRLGGGAGLGLSLSHYFAARQQGKLELINRVGQGAEAVLHLPQAHPIAATAVVPSTF